MSSSGTITSLSGATLAVNVGGPGEFTNGLSGNGTVGGLFSGIGAQNGSTIILGPGSTVGLDTTHAAGGTFTYSGTITNVGVALEKLGSGTLVLTGSNSYTGGTKLKGGTLLIGSDNALGTGALTTLDPTVAYANGVNITNPIIMMADTTLQVDNSDTATQTGTISESGGSYGIIKEGSGTLTLNGTNTYTGTTMIKDGTLALGTNGSIAASGGIVLANGGTTFDISGGGNQTILNLGSVAGSVVNLGANSLNVGNSAPSNGSFSGTMVGTGGSLVKSGTSSLSLNGANTYSGGTTLAGGILQAGSSTAFGTGTISFTGGTLQYGTGITQDFSSQFSNAANQLYSIDTNGNDVTFATSLSSTGGSLTKLGNGTLVLSGANTYSGGTTLGGGVIQADSATALGTGTVSFSGGTLQYGAGITQDFSAQFSAADNQPISIDTNGNNVTFAASLTGTGDSLTKLGAGTLTLAGTSAYYGTTTISSGTLTFTGDTSGMRGAIVNNAALVFDQATDSSYNRGFWGSISGSGSLTKQGTGTFTLATQAIYTGGTTISEGTLRYGDANALPAGSAVTLANVAGATLDLNGFLGQIASLSGGGTTGGNVTLGNLGRLTVGDSTSTTYSGIISGTGGPLELDSLVKIGSGTLTLNGSNTFTGTTRIREGTLALGTGGSLSFSNEVAVFGGATFDISQGGDQTIKHLVGGAGALVNLGQNILTLEQPGSTTYEGVIDGSMGSIVKQGAGVLALSGTNTYTGATTISAGTLALGPGGSIASSREVDIANGAILDISFGGNQAVQELNGASGSTVELGSNTLTDVTTGLTASIFSGVIQGNGGLTVQGTSTLTLSGTNTYTGLTTINAGTLALGTGGNIAASSGVNIASGATFDISGGTDQAVQDLSGATGSTVNLGAKVLTEGTANSTAFAGVIQGLGGSLIKQGTGTQVLSGNNTYSGGTTLNAGALVAANRNAFGTGAFTQTGGTLQTDNINHVIAIGSNFTQTAGSLVLNLNGVPGAANNDQLNVNGTAALGGNLGIHYTAGALAPNQSATYTVVTTTGGITNAGPGYTTPTAQMQAGALRLALTGTINGNDFEVTVKTAQLSFATLPGTNYTPNQKALATYFDQFAGGVTSGPVLSLVQALDAVSVDPAALASAFDQLTPLKFGSFTSSTSFNNLSFAIQSFDSYLANHRGADGTFIGSNGGIDYSGVAMSDPSVDSGLQSVRGRLLAWSPPSTPGLLSDTGNNVLSGLDLSDSKLTANAGQVDPWNVFIAGNVVLAQNFSDPSAGVAGGNSTTGAVMLGADYKITAHLRTGVLFGYGHTDATLDTIGSKASVDTYSPGVYASYTDHGWYVNALGSYGFANYDQNRNVSIGAFNGTAHSSPGGDQIVGNLDGGYDFHRGNWTFGPTLGAEYVHLDVNGYTETGLPGANLTVSSNSADSFRSLLGGRVSYAVRSGDITFTPHFSASWQHEYFNQSRGITSQFNGVGAGSFVVNTPNPSSNSALADLGLDAQVNKALTLFADYSLQAGQSNYFGQSVQAGLKIGF